MVSEASLLMGTLNFIQDFKDIERINEWAIEEMREKFNQSMAECLIHWLHVR
jgi:hypothetical protein